MLDQNLRFEENTVNFFLKKPNQRLYLLIK